MPETLSVSPLEVHRGDPRAVGTMLAVPGVLRKGHFCLLSGLHSDRFVAFSEIARDEYALGLLAAWLTPTVAASAPDGILSPSSAGLALGGALARQLGLPIQLASLDDTGRASGLQGEGRLDGRRLLLVNDVVTTAEGLRRLADLTRDHGGEVAAAAWFISRAATDVAAAVQAPTAYIADYPLTSCAPEDCPACLVGDRPELALDLN